VAAELCRGSKIDLSSSHDLIQLGFDLREPEKSNASIRPELDEDIDVARRREVITKDRSEQGDYLLVS